LRLGEPRRRKASYCGGLGFRALLTPEILRVFPISWRKIRRVYKLIIVTVTTTAAGEEAAVAENSPDVTKARTILSKEKLDQVIEAKKAIADAELVLWNARLELLATQVDEPNAAVARAKSHDDDTNNCNCRNNCIR